MAHAFQIGDVLHEVWLSRTARGYELHRGSERTAATLLPRSEHLHELIIGDATLPVYLAVNGDNVHVHLRGETYLLRYSHNLERFADERQQRAEGLARAPMPGAVIALHVEQGQAVKRGDVLLVIESMKMETAICAGLDGFVQQVHVQAGQTFDRDAILVSIEPPEAA